MIVELGLLGMQHALAAADVDLDIDLEVDRRLGVRRLRTGLWRWRDGDVWQRLANAATTT